MEDQNLIDQFKNQISEDIDLIQRNYKKIDNRLRINNYAFNFWVLQNIYNIDENLIKDHIVDGGKDKGIDCYVHYPESKILYFIQNKYYDEKTQVKREEITDFTNSPLDNLISNRYDKSPELQTLFNTIKEDKEYKYYFHFYVSNTKTSLDIKTTIDQFNKTTKYNIGELIKAEFININDLYDKYYGFKYKDKINFKYSFKTKFEKNILNILPENYDLPEMSKAYYMLTPVWQIWEMFKLAKEKKYPLFEENIREYLGDNDINGKIIETLKSETDRNNFFYYNNGITIICEDIPKEQTNLILKQPQIINGCQTVNSIYQCLNTYGTKENIQNEFKNVFVMSKILLFDQKTKEKKGESFYNDIVRYNNKQNPLNDKAFASKKPFFTAVKEALKDRGFLLLTQPSDKNTYNTDISKQDLNKLIDFSRQYSDKLGVELKTKKDLFIKLEKLLQVYIAFMEDGFYAFTKKSNLLRETSEYYSKYSLKINELISYDSLMILWLIYTRAEIEKETSEDQINPIPYYVIGFLGYLLKHNNKKDESLKSLIDKENDNFEKLYSYLKLLTSEYKLSYSEKYPRKEYNTMIKDQIDYEILNNNINTLNRIGIDKDFKSFLEKIRK